jgi:FMN phosphatase YigB (HAD superfamily)
MTPKFIYFDLGKVLLDFDFEQMYRQMGEAAGIEPRQVQTVLAAGWQADYEIGRLDSFAAHEVFCRQTGTRPDYEALLLAFNDIFTPIDSMLPVVAQLYQAGHRLGVLSNTCEGHWHYCLRRFTMLREFFSVHAVSFEIGGRPEEIFYADDIAGHVAGARGVGLDAVVYQSTPQVVAEVRERDVEFNY